MSLVASKQAARQATLLSVLQSLDQRLHLAVSHCLWGDKSWSPLRVPTRSTLWMTPIHGIRSIKLTRYTIPKSLSDSTSNFPTEPQYPNDIDSGDVIFDVSEHLGSLGAKLRRDSRINTEEDIIKQDSSSTSRFSRYQRSNTESGS